MAPRQRVPPRAQKSTESGTEDDSDRDSGVGGDAGEDEDTCSGSSAAENEGTQSDDPLQGGFRVFVSFKGNMEDEDFTQKLDSILSGIPNMLDMGTERLRPHHVEPWNSVRVTFNIPREAAERLRLLAQNNQQQLRDLGILSVQIEGEGAINVVPGPNRGQVNGPIGGPSQMRMDVGFPGQPGPGGVRMANPSMVPPGPGMPGQAMVPGSSGQMHPRVPRPSSQTDMMDPMMPGMSIQPQQQLQHQQSGPHGSGQMPPQAAHHMQALQAGRQLNPAALQQLQQQHHQQQAQQLSQLGSRPPFNSSGQMAMPPGWNQMPQSAQGNPAWRKPPPQGQMMQRPPSLASVQTPSHPPPPYPFGSQQAGQVFNAMGQAQLQQQQTGMSQFATPQPKGPQGGPVGVIGPPRPPPATSSNQGNLTAKSPGSSSSPFQGSPGTPPMMAQRPTTPQGFPQGVGSPGRAALGQQPGMQQGFMAMQQHGQPGAQVHPGLAKRPMGFPNSNFVQGQVSVNAPGGPMGGANQQLQSNQTLTHTGTQPSASTANSVQGHPHSQPNVMGVQSSMAGPLPGTTAGPQMMGLRHRARPVSSSPSQMAQAQGGGQTVLSRPLNQGQRGGMTPPKQLLPQQGQGVMHGQGQMVGGQGHQAMLLQQQQQNPMIEQMVANQMQGNKQAFGGKIPPGVMPGQMMRGPSPNIQGNMSQFQNQVQQMTPQQQQQMAQLQQQQLQQQHQLQQHQLQQQQHAQMNQQGQQVPLSGNPNQVMGMHGQQMRLPAGHPLIQQQLQQQQLQQQKQQQAMLQQQAAQQHPHPMGDPTGASGDMGVQQMVPDMQAQQQQGMMGGPQHMQMGNGHFPGHGMNFNPQFAGQMQMGGPCGQAGNFAGSKDVTLTSPLLVNLLQSDISASQFGPGGKQGAGGANQAKPKKKKPPRKKKSKEGEGQQGDGLGGIDAGLEDSELGEQSLGLDNPVTKIPEFPNRPTGFPGQSGDQRVLQQVPMQFMQQQQQQQQHQQHQQLQHMQQQQQLQQQQLQHLQQQQQQQQQQMHQMQGISGPQSGMSGAQSGMSQQQGLTGSQSGMPQQVMPGQQQGMPQSGMQQQGIPMQQQGMPGQQPGMVQQGVPGQQQVMTNAQSGMSGQQQGMQGPQQVIPGQQQLLTGPQQGMTGQQQGLPQGMVGLHQGQQASVQGQSQMHPHQVQQQQQTQQQSHLQQQQQQMMMMMKMQQEQAKNRMSMPPGSHLPPRGVANSPEVQRLPVSQQGNMPVMISLQGPGSVPPSPDKARGMPMMVNPQLTGASRRMSHPDVGQGQPTPPEETTVQLKMDRPHGPEITGQPPNGAQQMMANQGSNTLMIKQGQSPMPQHPGASPQQPLPNQPQQAGTMTGLHFPNVPTTSQSSRPKTPNRASPRPYHPLTPTNRPPSTEPNEINLSPERLNASIAGLFPPKINIPLPPRQPNLNRGFDQQGLNPTTLKAIGQAPPSLALPGNNSNGNASNNSHHSFPSGAGAGMAGAKQDKQSGVQGKRASPSNSRRSSPASSRKSATPSPGRQKGTKIACSPQQQLVSPQGQIMMLSPSGPMPPQAAGGMEVQQTQSPFNIIQGNNVEACKDSQGEPRPVPQSHAMRELTSPRLASPRIPTPQQTDSPGSNRHSQDVEISPALREAPTSLNQLLDNINVPVRPLQVGKTEGEKTHSNAQSLGQPSVPTTSDSKPAVTVLTSSHSQLQASIPSSVPCTTVNSSRTSNSNAMPSLCVNPQATIQHLNTTNTTTVNNPNPLTSVHASSVSTSSLTSTSTKPIPSTNKPVHSLIQIPSSSSTISPNQITVFVSSNTITSTPPSQPTTSMIAVPNKNLRPQDIRQQSPATRPQFITTTPLFINPIIQVPGASVTSNTTVGSQPLTMVQVSTANMQVSPALSSQPRPIQITTTLPSSVHNVNSQSNQQVSTAPAKQDNASDAIQKPSPPLQQPSPHPIPPVSSPFQPPMSSPPLSSSPAAITVVRKNSVSPSTSAQVITGDRPSYIVTTQALNLPTSSPLQMEIPTPSTPGHIAAHSQIVNQASISHASQIASQDAMANLTTAATMLSTVTAAHSSVPSLVPIMAVPVSEGGPGITSPANITSIQADPLTAESHSSSALDSSQTSTATSQDLTQTRESLGEEVSTGPEQGWAKKRKAPINLVPRAAAVEKPKGPSRRSSRAEKETEEEPVVDSSSRKRSARPATNTAVKETGASPTQAKRRKSK